MPRTAEQYEAMRAATRETVQTVAVRLFARGGFAATSMRDIACEAGVSTGLIYRHYATKEELFGDLLAQAVDGLAATADTLAGADQPQEATQDFTQRFLAGVAADGGAAEFFMMVNQGFTADEPMGTRERLVEEHRALRRAVVALVDHGQRLGQFIDGDPEDMAMCFLATLTGVVTVRLALGDEMTVPDAELAMRHLTGGSTR